MNYLNLAIQKISCEGKLNHHECSICGIMTYFYTHDNKLFFNSSCGCSDLNINPER